MLENFWVAERLVASQEGLSYVEVVSCVYISFFLWRYSPNLGLSVPPWNSPFHFGFLDLKTVSRTPWVGDQLVAKPLHLYTNTEKRTDTQTLNIHALSGIRTQDPGFRESEDNACLRPLGYRDRLCIQVTYRLLRKARFAFPLSGRSQCEICCIHFRILIVWNSYFKCFSRATKFL
jgi:hypothetical protein